jgi:hypothetical protein
MYFSHFFVPFFQQVSKIRPKDQNALKEIFWQVVKQARQGIDKQFDQMIEQWRLKYARDATKTLHAIYIADSLLGGMVSLKEEEDRVFAGGILVLPETISQSSVNIREEPAMIPAIRRHLGPRWKDVLVRLYMEIHSMESKSKVILQNSALFFC